MKRVLKVASLLLGIVILLATFPAYRFYTQISKALSDDPAVYAQDIADLVARTQEGPGKENAVVVLERDLQTTQCISRGTQGRW